jgi:hypothetical protein
MEIREHLSSNLPGREATYNSNRERSFQLIQCVVRQTTPCRGSDVAFREFQMIALAYTPSVESGFRENDAQGVSHTSYRQFHWTIVTCYNI